MKNRALLATLSVVPFLLLVAMAEAFGLWGALFPSPQWSQHFLDLAQVTATADCVASDPKWSMATATCDPIGRGYNYPSVWARVFSVLGIGYQDTNAVGWALVGVLAVSVMAITWLALRDAASPRAVWLVAVASASSPMFFAAERGNIDIIVFALAVATMLLYAARLRVLAAVTLVMAVAGKLFPVFAGPLFLLDSGRRRWVPLVTFCVGVVTAMWFALPELAYISQRTPMMLSRVVFGMSVPVLIVSDALGVHVSNVMALAAGGVVFLGMLAAFWWLSSRGRVFAGSVACTVDGFLRDRVSAILLLAGGGAFLGAYMMGVNNDYRLIWAIPVVAAFARVRSGGARLARWVAYAFVLILLASPYTVMDLDVLALALVMPVVAVVLARVCLHLMRSPSVSLDQSGLAGKELVSDGDHRA